MNFYRIPNCMTNNAPGTSTAYHAAQTDDQTAVLLRRFRQAHRRVLAIEQAPMGAGAVKDLVALKLDGIAAAVRATYPVAQTFVLLSMVDAGAEDAWDDWWVSDVLGLDGSSVADEDLTALEPLRDELADLSYDMPEHVLRSHPGLVSLEFGHHAVVNIDAALGTTRAAGPRSVAEAARDRGADLVDTYRAHHDDLDAAASTVVTNLLADLHQWAAVDGVDLEEAFTSAREWARDESDDQPKETTGSAADVATITTAEALEALPVGSVVLDGDEDAWQQRETGTGILWFCADRETLDDWDSNRLAGLLGPFTVLYRPDTVLETSGQNTTPVHELPDEGDCDGMREGVDLVDLIGRLAPEEPMNQDETGGCVWCGGSHTSGLYATADPQDHQSDCPWLEAREALASELKSGNTLDETTTTEGLDSLPVSLVCLRDLPDGRYYDGTYEWDKEGDEWTPLRAPFGMPSQPQARGLQRVVTAYVPVTEPSPSAHGREALVKKARRLADTLDAIDDHGCQHDHVDCERKIEVWSGGEEFTTDELRTLADLADSAIPTV